MQAGFRAAAGDIARGLAGSASALLIVLATADLAAAQDAAAASGAAAATQDAQGQTPSAIEISPYTPLEPEGDTVWGLFYGFGFNQVINNSVPGIHAATVGFRWSHMWKARLGSFIRGHPAFAIEIVPLTTFVQSDKPTYAVGFNLVYEHHFAVAGRVLPVWRLGAGFLYSNIKLPDGETRENFSLLTALGVDIMVTDSSALFLGYRFHHVSNANIGDVNPGVNLHTMMFGLSFYR